NATLGSTAHAHSRAMANGNFFAHRDADGLIPGDRVELAGYSASAVGENIAAALDTPQLVLDAWLSSSGHCATLMNLRYRVVGLAYADDPTRADAVFSTALFATPCGQDASAGVLARARTGVVGLRLLGQSRRGCRMAIISALYYS